MPSSELITDKERRRLRRQARKAQNVLKKGPRRLTESGALELAICLAQHFYYELDAPIMSDAEYDRLEARYIKLLRMNKVHGVIADLLKKVGSGDNIRDWLFKWRNE